ALLTSAALSWCDPPASTALSSDRITHSPTFPSMSYSPHALGAFVATLCGSSFELLVNHATRSRSFPSGRTACGEPARHAYSHSASVGRRYRFPVVRFSHSMYTRTVCSVIPWIGHP